MVAVAGKVVVVTGGRRGLGAALVDELLARGVRKIYSTGRSSFTDERPEVVPVELEVRSEASVSAFAELASDAEVIFNNAGILLPGSLLTGGFDDIEATFDINVFGPLRVARAFAPILAANGGGAVVNMHSVRSWVAGSAAYGASKAAIWSVTKTPQGYKVSNLTVAGINLTLTQAADFDAYIQRNGFDKLVAFMKSKG